MAFTMHARSADTDAATEAAHLALLRQAPVERRLALAVSLSETVTRLARRAIERSFPEQTDAERTVRFVEVHYGRPLAEALDDLLSSERR